MFEARDPGAAARARVGASRLFRRLLRVTGQSESYVEEKMQPLYAKWLAAPTRIATTILASLGQIELHLTRQRAERGRGAWRARRGGEEVQATLGRDLFSTNGETMQQVVGELCRSRGLANRRRRVVHRAASSWRG